LVSRWDSRCAAEAQKRLSPQRSESRRMMSQLGNHPCVRAKDVKDTLAYYHATSAEAA
jgi:predicted transcriptional regulator